MSAVSKIGKLGDLAKKIPVPDVLKFFNNLVDAYKEGQVTEREIAKINANKEVMLAEISGKYETYRLVFNRIFDERKEVIDRFFDVIDKGVASNDKQIILGGLEGLSRIVSASPFANTEQLSRLLESGKALEI